MVLIRVSRVELEAVDAVVPLHFLKDVPKMGAGLRVAKVIACARTVPPVVDRRHIAAFPFGQVALPHQVSVLFAVSGHERTYPKHHLESHCVEFVHHPFGIGKPVRTELKIAVVLLPVVVDHQYASGEAVADNAPCVFQNVLLVLVVHQLDPCVVLRLREKNGGRQLAVRREMLP